MFFILVHVTFLAADASITLAHRRHSPHTDSISSSAILRNNHISLLSDLCTCVHVKKKLASKGSHSSSVSGSNRLVWLQASLVPRRYFVIWRKNTSGDLPIPFWFWCARMLAHCSILI